MTRNADVPPVDTENTPLEPEGSVPVSGFSLELRHACDVERFRFAFSMHGGAPYPVHVVFSSSRRTAEIKAGDLSAFCVTEVDSVEEARRRWVAWWRNRRGRRPAIVAPPRTGRSPKAWNTERGAMWRFLRRAKEAQSGLEP